MKAQPKHLSCIAVAAFHLACMQHQKLQQEQGKDNLIVVPEPLDLVNISQSRCSPSDLLRMRAILASKLEMNPGAGPEQPVTPLTMLRLMFNVSRAAANHLGLKLFTEIPDQLLHQLEILACDSLTLQYRPAEVALALLATNFQQRASREPGHSTALMGFISELQKYCNVSFLKHFQIPVILTLILIVTDSIEQLCRLSRNRGQPVGQVQQRMYGSSPTKAGLEIVHADLETFEAH